MAKIVALWLTFSRHINWKNENEVFKIIILNNSISLTRNGINSLLKVSGVHSDYQFDYNNF